MIRNKFSKNMDILFVGINPHIGSYRRGVPFSNNKMFWYILNDARILNEKREDLRRDHELKKIYNQKFNQAYNLGFMNIINRPTIKITELKKGEEILGRKKIISAIKNYRPKIVCFIGKAAYEKFTGKKKFGYGPKEDISGSKTYVLHFPIRGRALVRINELKKIKKMLT